MKKISTTISLLSLAIASQAQTTFPVKIDPTWDVQTVWMPKSPLTNQVIFVGGTDIVQTTSTYGNVAGQEVAKQWHDYIGFVPDKPESGHIGWAVVNHEMAIANPKLGDGGGMTMFKLKRNTVKDSLEVVTQKLADGREGKFFNVDFVNTVGETGMNCGGITTTDGRMWTAEEWMRRSNKSLFNDGKNFKDTTDFIIGTTKPAGFPGFNGQVLKRFQNLNWMVEIDPKQAKAVRKQYNWGRAGWEGGVALADNKTVFLFEDGSPGILGKFVATSANDFTTGQMYVYKHDRNDAIDGNWIKIENNLDTLKELNSVAIKRGATMFNRLEWGQKLNETKIYITETGRDKFDYNSGNALNGVISPTLVDGYKTRYQIEKGMPFPGTDMAAADSVRKGRFADYYGRVIELDLTTNKVRSYIEGGPLSTALASSSLLAYPTIHFSNPDGLDFMTLKGKRYMIIQEDLNGVTYNRMPATYTKTNCETYLLDMEIVNPTFNDLIRISASAPGAEVTGAVMIDENTMLLNSQHPDGGNTFPYNNSLTHSISGWANINPTGLFSRGSEVAEPFSIYPNPTSRELHLQKASDIAIYNAKGERIRVERDVKVINVSDMNAGIYFISNAEGQTTKFVVE